MRFEVPNKGHIGRTLLEKLSPAQIASGLTEPGRINHSICGVVVEITAGGHRDLITVDIDPQVSLKAVHYGKGPLVVPVAYSVDDLPDCQKVLPSGATVSLNLELSLEVTWSSDDDLILSFVDHKEKMDIADDSDIIPTLRIKSILLDSSPSDKTITPTCLGGVCVAVIPPGISSAPNGIISALTTRSVIRLKTVSYVAYRLDEARHPVQIHDHHPADNPQTSMLAFAAFVDGVFSINYPTTITLGDTGETVDAIITFQYNQHTNQIEAYLRNGWSLDAQTGVQKSFPEGFVIGLDSLLISVG